MNNPEQIYKIRVLNTHYLPNNLDNKRIHIILIPTIKHPIKRYNNRKVLILSEQKIDHQKRFIEVSNRIKNWKVFPQTVRNLRITANSKYHEKYNRLCLKINKEILNII